MKSSCRNLWCDKPSLGKQWFKKRHTFSVHWQQGHYKIENRRRNIYMWRLQAIAIVEHQWILDEQKRRSERVPSRKTRVVTFSDAQFLKIENKTIANSLLWLWIKCNVIRVYFMLTPGCDGKLALTQIFALHKSYNINKSK